MKYRMTSTTAGIPSSQPMKYLPMMNSSQMLVVDGFMMPGTSSMVS
jgi:hypothetical protein